MSTPRTRANARKQAERAKAEAREKRRLYFMKRGEKIVPDKILRQLAALNLPPIPWVYEVCLRELERNAT